MRARSIQPLAAMYTLLIGMSACGGGGGGNGGPTLIDPSNPNAITAVMTTKSGEKIAVLVGGNPPTISPDAERPTADIATPSVTVRPGDSVSVPVQFKSDSDASICTIYMKVKGSDKFFEIQLNCPAAPAGVAAKASEEIKELTISIPATVQQGQFCAEVTGKDDNALVSNVAEFCVDVITANSVISVDPKATYLVTTDDPQAVHTVPIDLAAQGISGGQKITLSPIGRIIYYTGCADCDPPIAAEPSEIPDMLAMFSASSSSSDALDSGEPSFVVAAPPDVIAPADVPFDFYFNNTTVTVPSGAKFLFVQVVDWFYGDNGGTVAVGISK